MEVKFPHKLQPLFEPHRYKVAYGGRGSGKSWSFARALLLLGAQKKLRILCAREVQKSIKYSVHTLLRDQISALGLDGFYDVLETAIRGKNGTEFSFAGLSALTADSMKSYEGVDIYWLEEAQTITKQSYGALIPTIRKADSEIWVSFNPELDTDESWVRFVINPPPDAVVMHVNYTDNPWFPDVLEKERLHCLATDPDDYSTIWEGKCRKTVIGAIYGREIDAAHREGRICNVPYDPRLKVHTVWDLGWNDSMTVSLVQRVRSELRVIDYIEENHKTLDWYAAELNQRRLNWGFDWLPHDGFSRDYKTGKSAEEILKAFGRNVKPQREAVPNIDVESGIKAARMTFPLTVFDKQKTSRLIECLSRYRRSINRQTKTPGGPLHDENSHGADNYRYLALVADQLENNPPARQDYVVTPWRPIDSSMGY